MTLLDITCFMKVAETLNYTKASKELFISQPAVTRHIHSLEEEYGAPLIDRNVKRSIQLTEIGEILYEGLKQCGDIYQQTLNNIQLRTQNTLLLFNLMRGTTFPDHIIQTTRQFMLEHPDFRHFVNFIEYDSFASCLDRGEILFCARELMPAGKCYQALKMNTAPIPYYIVASQKHKAFSNRQNVALNDLADTTLFLPKMLPKNVREMINNMLLQLFGKSPREVIYLDSVDSVSLFLRSNECFTVCTGWHTDVKSSEFRALPLPLFTDYYAMWHSERVKSPEALSYIQALRDSEKH